MPKRILKQNAIKSKLVVHYKPWLALSFVVLIIVGIGFYDLVADVIVREIGGIELYSRVAVLLSVLVVVAFTFYRGFFSLEIDGNSLTIRKVPIVPARKFSLQDITSVNQIVSIKGSNWRRGRKGCIFIRFRDGSQVKLTPEAVGYKLLINRLKSLDSFSSEKYMDVEAEKALKSKGIFREIIFWVLIVLALYIYQRYFRR